MEAHHGSRTRDVEVEDVIFLDDVVDQLLAVLVDNEYLPLGTVSRAWAARRPGERTSPRVVCWMALSMTRGRVSTGSRRPGVRSAECAYGLSGCLSSRPWLAGYGSS